MTVVAVLVALAIGLMAGYAIGSAGPCPDCDGWAVNPQGSGPCSESCYTDGRHETADGIAYVKDKKTGWWRRG